MVLEEQYPRLFYSHSHVHSHTNTRNAILKLKSDSNIRDGCVCVCARVRIPDVENAYSTILVMQSNKFGDHYS